MIIFTSNFDLNMDFICCITIEKVRQITPTDSFKVG